jgi:hypothetical protein
MGFHLGHGERLVKQSGRLGQPFAEGGAGGGERDPVIGEDLRGEAAAYRGEPDEDMTRGERVIARVLCGAFERAFKAGRDGRASGPRALGARASATTLVRGPL